MKNNSEPSQELKENMPEDESTLPEYLHIEREANKNKKYFIETHGCQMNVADTEIVQSIMESAGFESTEAMNNVNFIKLINIGGCCVSEHLCNQRRS